MAIFLLPFRSTLYIVAMLPFRCRLFILAMDSANGELTIHGEQGGRCREAVVLRGLSVVCLIAVEHRPLLNFAIIYRKGIQMTLSILQICYIAEKTHVMTATIIVQAVILAVLLLKIGAYTN